MKGAFYDFLRRIFSLSRGKAWVGWRKTIIFAFFLLSAFYESLNIHLYSNSVCSCCVYDENFFICSSSSQTQPTAKKEENFSFLFILLLPAPMSTTAGSRALFFLFSSSTLKPWNMNDIKTCIWVRGRARERKVWKSREATGFFRRRRRRKMKNNFGTRHCWREFKCERRWCASRPKSTAEREKMLIIWGLWKKICNFTRDKKRERKKVEWARKIVLLH